MASDRKGVLDDLEQGMAERTREDRDEQIAELREAVAGAQGNYPVMEGGLIQVVVFALLAIGMLAFTPYSEGFSMMWPSLLVTAIPIGTIVWWILRQKLPLLVMTEQGLMLPQLQNVVPWTAIEDYEVRVIGIPVKTMVHLDLYLAEDYELGPRTGRRYGTISYGKQRNGNQVVSIMLFNFRGKMNEDKFEGLFNSYWRAGVARVQLRELGA